MASFTDEEINQQALDWEILRDGGICLYWRLEFLKADLQWLQDHRYEIKIFDSGSWHSELLMHIDLSSELAFPSYYGRNLNALNDCMSEDLVVPDAGGMVLCLKRFDQFAVNFKQVHAVLDIFASASRIHMLQGKRLLIILQSNDARINFTGLGHIHAAWNRREWLHKNRSL